MAAEVVAAMSTKWADTVGHPPNAKNSASHMLSLKVQKSQESNAITVAVSRENRMTNNIWAFSEPRGLMYLTFPYRDFRKYGG